MIIVLILVITAHSARGVILKKSDPDGAQNTWNYYYFYSSSFICIFYLLHILHHHDLQPLISFLQAVAPRRKIASLSSPLPQSRTPPLPDQLSSDRRLILQVSQYRRLFFRLRLARCWKHLNWRRKEAELRSMIRCLHCLMTWQKSSRTPTIPTRQHLTLFVTRYIHLTFFFIFFYTACFNASWSECSSSSVAYACCAASPSITLCTIVRRKI